MATPKPSKSNSDQKERYTMGYDATAVQYQQSHTAAKDAGFFLPHLRPGMSLLDCGCGPGTLTAGLAGVVAPGQVIGIDREAGQVEIAQAHADEKGFSNLRFEVGDVYALPFPDASFDAVFANALLVHLRHQLGVLREMYRVLRPGGVIGIRNPDYSGHLLACSDPLVGKSQRLLLRLFKHNGATLHTGRHQRGLLHRAGFVRIEATAAYDEASGTSELVRKLATARVALWTKSDRAAQIVKLGWTDRTELKKISAAWKAWGESPDAFFARAWGQAVGWKE